MFPRYIYLFSFCSKGGIFLEGAAKVQILSKGKGKSKKWKKRWLRLVTGSLLIFENTHAAEHSNHIPLSEYFLTLKEGEKAFVVF